MHLQADPRETQGQSSQLVDVKPEVKEKTPEEKQRDLEAQQTKEVGHLHDHW